MVFAVALLQQAKDFLAVLAVQAAGGLIRQHDSGRIHQRPADGHPLLLPAGELVGQVASAVLEAQEGQQLLQPFLVDLPVIHQDGQGDVLHHVQGGDEVVKLVDHPHLPPAENGQLLSVLGVHVLPVEENRPAGRDVYPGNDVKQRGFTGAGGADDGGKFPLRNGQRDVVQGGHLIVPFAVSFAQILDFQKFHTVDLLCWNLSLS